MRDQETLCLSGRLKLAHDLFSSSCWSVTAFNPVVNALVGPVVSLRRLMGNRLDVAVQLVCNDDPLLAELRNQPCHEALGSFGIPTGLHENIKRVALGIDRPPEPVLHPVDRDHNLVQMPFAIWAGTVPTDTGGKMRAKPIDPETDGFTAHDDTSFGEQILDIRCAQRKPMVCPDSVGDNLAWKTKALQVRHGRRYFHPSTRSEVTPRKQLGNAYTAAHFQFTALYDNI